MEDELLQKDKKDYLKVSNKNINNQFSPATSRHISDLTDDYLSNVENKDFFDEEELSEDHLGDSSLGDPKSGSLSLLLAEKFDEESNDPTGYYISEKLDGVRCFWNGKKMFTRNGNPIICPSFFTKNWPKSQLDGELWVKRNCFQGCIRIVKHKVIF